MERRVARNLMVVQLCLFLMFVSTVFYPARLADAASFPSIVRSGTIITITNALISSQFDLGRSTVSISYPQDQQQQFRLLISFLRLMEVTASNLTTPPLAVDSLSLSSVSWSFTQLGNASEARFGSNLQAQLSTTIHLQRGTYDYPVNITLNVFSSAKQNETTIVTNDWVAVEPVGGPTQTKIDLSITGWPFRALTDSLVLRVLVDGSQGTVNHHEGFTATELFNTVAIVNDVTQRQDASMEWLRRAVVNNGTKTSADVLLNTSPIGEGLDVDLYYPSFTVGTLIHSILLETSNSFQPAGYVPFQILTPTIVAATLSLLTLSIAYFSRRQQFVLRRNR